MPRVPEPCRGHRLGGPWVGNVPKRGAGSWRPSSGSAAPPRRPLPRPSPQASAPAVPPVRPRPPGPAAAGKGRGRGEGGRWSRWGSRPRFSGSPALAPLCPSCVTAGTAGAGAEPGAGLVLPRPRSRRLGPRGAWRRPHFDHLRVFSSILRARSPQSRCAAGPAGPPAAPGVPVAAAAEGTKPSPPQHPKIPLLCPAGISPAPAVAFGVKPRNPAPGRKTNSSCPPQIPPTFLFLPSVSPGV